jgi:ATP-dependent Lon protease
MANGLELNCANIWSFALEGRRRVKEQLKKLAAHDYSKSSFSYIERDSDREVWVEVPERPEEANLVEAVIEAAAPEPVEPESKASSLTVEELIAGGESRVVEFKSSARWSYGKGDRDEVIERTVVKTVAGFMNAQAGRCSSGSTMRARRSDWRRTTSSSKAAHVMASRPG